MIHGISDKVNKMVQSIISDQGPVAQQNRAAAQSVNPDTNLPNNQLKPNKIDIEVVQDAVNKINDEASRADAKVSLSVDHELNRVLIRFKDPTSGEIVRQIPPDAVLEMLKRLDDLRGAMFDTKG